MEDAELLDGDEVGAGVGPGQDLLFRLSHNQGHLDREAAGLMSEPSINNQHKNIVELSSDFHLLNRYKPDSVRFKVSRGHQVCAGAPCCG